VEPALFTGRTVADGCLTRSRRVISICSMAYSKAAKRLRQRDAPWRSAGCAVEVTPGGPINERRQLEKLAAERTSQAPLRTTFETKWVLRCLLAVEGALLDANATSPELPRLLGASAFDRRFRSGCRQACGASIRPIRHPEAAVIAIVPEASDISERRLVREALRQSQKLEAMGQLTGGVAHDFHNLLTPIIGTLDLLIRRSVGTTRERRLIDAGTKSAERAKTLVQRLLASARRQPFQIDAVDVSSRVSVMAGLLGQDGGTADQSDLAGRRALRASLA